jgi:hypothetical protein
MDKNAIINRLAAYNPTVAAAFSELVRFSLVRNHAQTDEEEMGAHSTVLNIVADVLADIAEAANPGLELTDTDRESLYGLICERDRNLRMSASQGRMDGRLSVN